MTDRIDVRWTKRGAEEGGNSPRISFYGLLVPYLHYPGTDLTWSARSATSPTERFVEALVLDRAITRISGGRLERITGIPAAFWHGTLLDLERAGHLVALDDSGSDRKYQLRSQSGRTLSQHSDTQILHRPARAVRDLLFFPESFDVLIAEGKSDGLIGAFINAFTAGQMEWFRTPLTPPPMRRTLRAHLTDIAQARLPLGLDETVNDVSFGVSGPLPAVAATRAMAGYVAVAGSTAVPWFTHVYRPDEPPLSPALDRGGSTRQYRFDLSAIPALAERILRGLEVCQEEEFLDMAIAAAPEQIDDYRTLHMDAPFSWRIESESPARHDLDVRLADIRFRIAVRTSRVGTET